ncbi:MAG TPA: hypothetical protein VHY84_02505 [Bryobacteraceae bacterium]|nr:hypothetical protein [Bryobacteraceae bacterium]
MSLILLALSLVQSPLFPQLSPNAADGQSGAAAVPAPTPAGGGDSHTPLPGEPGSGVDKRIFGVLPNYRTADGTMPFRPITTKQKYTIAMKDTFDYPSYVLAAAFAGISQEDDSNPSFGQGLKGYARRYASSVADQDLGNFMTEAIWPSMLHEDPRYFRKVHGSFWGRLGYASTRVFVTRTDAGNWRFNTSEWMGNGTVAAIGNAYYPDARGFGPTMQRMGTQVGTDAISCVLKEFWPDIKRKWLHKRNSGPSSD